MASLRDRLVGSINSSDITAQSHIIAQQVDREKGELRRRHIEAELDRKTLDLEAARETRDESRSLVDRTAGSASEV